jgi:uncharacterized protein YndB with AHSA1/START domain
MLNIRYERTLSHPRETVWDFLLDPEAAKDWLGVVHYFMPRREGAAFCWLYDPGSRRPAAYVGRVMKLDRPSRIELSLGLLTCATDTTVVWELTEPRPGHTMLVLRHENLPDTGVGRFEYDGFHHHWEHFVDLIVANLDGATQNFHLLHRAELGVIPVGVAPNQGLLVHDVAVGTPADDAGIRAGEIIRAVDGTALNRMEDFDAWIDACRPGHVARIDVGDRSLTVVLRAKQYAPA